MARSMAMVGGLVLILLIVLTSLSVAGRSLTDLGLNQIPGDFELVELGVGFAIFSFLPWTQFARGHARVDMFVPVFGPFLNGVLDVIADLLMLAAASVMAWCLWLGMIDKHTYGETTFILQLPLWQAYLAGLIGAVVFTLVAAFSVLRSLKALSRNR